MLTHGLVARSGENGTGTWAYTSSCCPRWSRCHRWIGSCWLGTLWHGMGRKRGSFRDPFRGRFCKPTMHPMGPRSDSCPREMLRLDVSSSRAGAIALHVCRRELRSRCCSTPAVG